VKCNLVNGRPPIAVSAIKPAQVAPPSGAVAQGRQGAAPRRSYPSRRCTARCPLATAESVATLRSILDEAPWNQRAPSTFSRPET
jgi:hypothetical protein